MRRLAAALLAAAALCSCKRDAPPAATPAAPSPVPSSPAASRPSSGAALSYFEPIDGTCAWFRHDAGASSRTELARIPGTCEGARVAWNADRTRALLWTEIGDPPVSSLFEAESGGVRPRAAPPIGTLRDAGFDARGRLLALTLEEIPAAQAKKGFAMADGAKLSVPQEMDGLPALARAFRWEDGDWKRIETKVSDDAWDLALGVAALDAEKTLGDRSWKALARAPEGREATPAETKSLDAGCGAKKGPDEAAWFKLQTAAGVPATFVRLEDIDFVVTLSPVCVVDEKGAAAPLALDLDPEDSIATQLSGAWLLVSDSGGHRPHLVDLPSRTTRWSSRAATEAVFWP